MKHAALLGAVALTFAACGDDAGDDVDAAGIDAVATADRPVGGPAENLGTPCSQMVPCPNSETCIILAGASQTEGFCSIACATNSECAAGYAGGGTPACNYDDGLGGMFCTVGCTIGGSGECDPALQCFEFGAIDFCAGDD